ncbi:MULTISPECIES: tetratricopeptide repeat protein [unclassified Gilliamella]|uniref:tetratricopeptide repeat protein n=1 Tax=unclassified Gilliamella TaxID=2685620 RepID=UPI0018DDABCB|nr:MULTISPECIES: tetratricopeptide repeat protein [unclassified Gilliamella]MBI0113967.1 sel1 repeat family protein [Gilliamella sp. W8123]MBI0117504.1 sel1 repeat family protein [Gilliamella sp. W8129]
MNIKKLLLVIPLLFSFATYARDCATEFENKNYEKALVECTQEAEENDKVAQYNLARMYDDGEGIEQDKQKAVYWYTKAAEQGYSSAQYNLAVMYNEGDGVEQNKSLAKEYFKQSCDLGFELACEELRK